MKKKAKLQPKRPKVHRRKHKRPNPAYGIVSEAISVGAAIRALFGPTLRSTGTLFKCQSDGCRAEFGVSGDTSKIRFCIYCRGPVRRFNNGVIDAEFEEVKDVRLLEPPTDKVQ